ncbi:MAG: cation-translocating P-type ATPase [Phycisphaerales bacterium]|nr:cation-translocating P-type ATPase [Phycisphaerales bacterium]
MPEPGPTNPGTQESHRRDLPHALPAAIVAGILLAASFLMGWLDLADQAAALAWISLAIGGIYSAWDALGSLFRLRFDIDALMVVAAGLAGATGHPSDGALLLFLFTLAGALETRAMARTRNAIEALHRLMPTAAVAWDTAASAWIDVDPASLAPDRRILIRTGQTIPADSRITRGRSSIDQATLTGESVPRAVEEGDEVYAGTINLDHPLEAEVTRAAGESSLQRILNLVLEAQQRREPIQRIIDRLSQPYAVGVTLLSIAVFLVWWKVFNFPPTSAAAAASGNAGEPDAVTTAITLLIVASPCALVIATPTATLAAISRGARSGVLLKGGQAIERLARAGALCLDKTGTLTFGRPRLAQVHVIAGPDGPDYLAVAAALESGSTHPIAVAIQERAAALSITPPDITNLQDLPGRGLSGVIGGRDARLGTFEHVKPLVPPALHPRMREALDRARLRGDMGTALAWESAAGPHALVLVLADALRPGAVALVERLHALGISPVRMLTGDNAITARTIAQRTGVDAFDAELLPQDKVRIVQEMKHAATPPTPVAVVGDGVNDAPALAAADVSIAIGSIGSDAALESADIVLLNDDLLTVPWAIRLARHARSVVAFNLAVALGTIAFMAGITLAGSLLGYRVPLSIAVLTHEGGTLLVVLNSLRLLLVPGPAENPLPVPVLPVSAPPLPA